MYLVILSHAFALEQWCHLKPDMESNEGSMDMVS